MTRRAESHPASGARRLGMLLLLVAVLGGAWWLSKRMADLPPPAEGPPVAFLNTRPDIAYVGSAACKACHEALCDSHAATAHGRSFGRPDAGAASARGAIYDQTSGLALEAYERDGELRIRTTLPVSADVVSEIDDRAVRYQIGSGAGVRSFLAAEGDFLVQAPLSAHPVGGTWGITPTMRSMPTPGFGAAIEWRCLACHTGRVEVVEPRTDRLRVLEEAIGCESCHGPGALHVERHREGGAAKAPSGAFDPTIANPARMTRTQSSDVCSRCHEPAELTVPIRGVRLSDWRPGLLLRHFRARYRQEPPDGIVAESGLAEQLAASRCFQEARTLSCETCHDPHVALPLDARPQHYRRACLACHGPEACGEPEPRRREVTPDDSCEVCHMPRLGPRQAHRPFTQHRIGLYARPAPRSPDTPLAGDPAAGPGGPPRPPPMPPPGTPGAAPQTDPRLVAVEDLAHLSPEDRDRCEGLAYFQRLSLGGSDPAAQEVFRRKAQELLEAAREAGARDAEATTVLSLLAMNKRPMASFEQAREAVASDDDVQGYVRATALATLARWHFQSAEFDEAIRALQRLLEVRHSPSDWRQLAETARAREDRDGALHAIRMALAFAPHDAEVQYSAGSIFRWLGDEAEAQQHDLLGQQLSVRRGRPDPRLR